MNDAALAAGLELVRRGEYFEAHEELEIAWRSAEAVERDFCQGLVHVAVAWYQAGRGKRTGCERQLEKARRRLSPYAPAHRGSTSRPFSHRSIAPPSGSLPGRSSSIPWSFRLVAAEPSRAGG